MMTKLEMEQLDIVLGNYLKKDGKKGATPKISENATNGDLKEQVKATVLEASKSFQSSESKGSMLAPKEQKEPTGNRVRFAE
jgi:hypothetical protein